MKILLGVYTAGAIGAGVVATVVEPAPHEGIVYGKVHKTVTEPSNALPPLGAKWLAFAWGESGRTKDVYKVKIAKCPNNELPPQQEIEAKCRTNIVWVSPEANQKVEEGKYVNLDTLPNGK